MIPAGQRGTDGDTYVPVYFVLFDDGGNPGVSGIPSLTLRNTDTHYAFAPSSEYIDSNDNLNISEFDRAIVLRTLGFTELSVGQTGQQGPVGPAGTNGADGAPGEDGDTYIPVYFNPTADPRTWGATPVSYTHLTLPTKRIV